MDCTLILFQCCINLYVSLILDQGQAIISLNNQGTAFGLVGSKKLFDDPVYSPLVRVMLLIRAIKQKWYLIRTFSVHSFMGLYLVLPFQLFFTRFTAGGQDGVSILSMFLYSPVHCKHSHRIISYY
jgi:hypothetical protein